LSAEKDKMVGGLCHVLVGFRTPIPSLKPCEKHCMIFSGALGVHSDVYVYIYISLSLACPWTQQSASQLVFSNFSIKTYYPQSNVASWEIPKGNGGVVRWESHIDFPSRARQLAPVASQVRKAFANFMCGAPDFKNWNPKIGISIVNDLQIDFLTIGTCLPDS